MNNFEEEINYIYAYIKSTFFSVKEFNDDSLLLDLSKKIKRSMPNTIFNSGKYDFAISNFVYNEMRSRKSQSFEQYNELRKHMYILVQYCKNNLSFRIDDVEFYVIEMMKYASGKFDYDKIILGFYDEELENRILIGFDKPISKDSNDKFFVKEYVYDRLLNLKGVFVYNGNLNDLAEKLANDLEKRSFSSASILNGDCDDIIDSYVMEKRYGIDLSDEYIAICREARKHIEANNTYMKVGTQQENISNEIFELSMYLLKNGYTYNDVRSGQCNNIIEGHIRTSCIIANSKTCTRTKGLDKDPNKFLLKCRKAIKTHGIKAAALITAASILCTTAYKIDDTKTSREAYKSFDTYEYQDSYPIDNGFEMNLEHILDYYDDYIQYGEEYGQICLYRVYEQTDERPFFAMDTLCSFLKNRAENSDEYAPVMDEISTSKSYVDYVYSKLCEIDESYKDKYAKAVRAYNSQVGNYKQYNAFYAVEKNSKEDARAIKAMMREYGRYIDRLELEMGKEIKTEQVK